MLVGNDSNQVGYNNLQPLQINNYRKLNLETVFLVSIA